MVPQKLKGKFHILRFVFILFFIGMGDISDPMAQQANFWSPQESIPEYEIHNNEQPPHLIADQNHVVHAFNTQSLVLGDESAPKAIFYRQWTLENGWTYPNDILVDASGGSIDLIGVSSDPSGMVHLVYQKDFDKIYYTNAYLAKAHDPIAWSIPVYIAGQSVHVRPGIPIIGAIANDATSSKIVIVFGGSQYGNGLYYSLSPDLGSSWTEPYPVYLTGSPSLIVSDPKLYLGASGILHAVWTTIREDGFGGPGFYSGFDLENDKWSYPIELDVPGIRTPSVVEHNGEVFVSYHHISSNGNWSRRSDDNGLTWTSPIRITPQYVGTNGGLSFVTDSNNILHAFFGERLKGDEIHGMWHISWTGVTWTNPEAVVQGNQVKDVIGGNGFDPTYARAVVSNGNLLLVAWGTDGAAGQNGAWYSYRILDTPALPGQPLALPTAAADGIKRPVATRVVDEMTPAVDIDRNNEQREFLQNPQFPLLVAVIPAFLLLVGLIILRIYLGSKHP